VTATFDTNLLLYASDGASPHQEHAVRRLDELTTGPALVYVLWPVAMGYLRIATHSAIFDNPLTPEEALGNLQTLLDRPAVRTAGESDRFWQSFLDVSGDVPPRGNLVPDAHIVALMRDHGIRTIWTHDRGFRAFDGIRVRDPLT